MKYLVAGLVILLFVGVIIKNTHLCTGGKLMRGCYKVLFPWSKRIKITLGDQTSYCCMECLKRDIVLYSGEGEDLGAFYQAKGTASGCAGRTREAATAGVHSHQGTGR